MRLLAGLLLLLAGCATVPQARFLPSQPRETPIPAYDFPVPTPSWPLRQGDTPRASAPPATPAPVSWSRPDPVFPVVAPAPAPLAAPVAPAAAPALPLPDVVPLPVKQTPASRSWSTVAQEKVPVLPLPVAPAPSAPPAPASTAKAAPAKAEAKVPATTPAKPQPAVRPAATPPPTAAATASLLPTDTTSAPDFHWEDVNAVAGDAVTLHFDKTNWLYLDSPAQQKTLGFQSISRDKDATTFQFRPMTPGQYTLEFQRQDLVNQSTDLRKVKLTVVPVGTRTTASGTALAPQISTVSVNDALEASRQLAAAGKTSEAVQKLLQSYRADDARINLELARLLNQNGQQDEALSYLDKNLTLSGPDFQGTLELGTRIAATRDPQGKLPAYVKLWTAGTTAPSEDLYLQAFEALRVQKLGAQAKDWSTRYAGWYPAPQLRDQYLFQLGQLLEEPGDNRDIRGAWKAYTEVVESYPLSPFWKAAGERAAYLNRHFLQVR